MDKKVITSDKAPKAIGPYSVAIRTGDLVFTSGQLGLDPTTSSLVPGGIEAETRQALTNLHHVLGGCRVWVGAGGQNHRLPERHD